MNQNSDLQRLRLAVIELYRRSAASDEAPVLQSAATTLEHLEWDSRAPIRSSRLQVCEHVERALAEAQKGPLACLAAALAPILANGQWLQNPNYVATPPDPGFLANYGYVEFVGPSRIFPHEHLRVGALLLAPFTHYPEHWHPAVETYHVVSGHAMWLRDNDTWRSQPPGATIFHPSRMRHATKTEAEPMLALYCWTGQIGPPASLTG